MKFTEYIKKAISIALIKNDKTGIWYISPFYRIFLNEEGYSIYDIEDIRYIDDNMVDTIIERECKIRNMEHEEKKAAVIDWIYKALYEEVPEMIKEKEGEIIHLLEDKQNENASMDIKDKISFEKK